MNKKHSQTMSVKLTETESIKLNKMLEKLKITKSEYIRNLINGHYKNEFENNNDKNNE